MSLNSKTTVQQPFNHHSTTIQQPFNHRSTTVQPPFNNHSTTVQQPFNNRSTTVQQPFNNIQQHSTLISTSTPPSRLLYLDSARGIATLSILTVHFLMAVYGMNMAGLELGKPLHLFLFGEANIIFFFIHSGFILSYTFTRRNRSLSFRSYARFLVERIFRIYPLFLAMLAVSFIVFSNVSPYTARNEYDWVARFWYSETGISDVMKQAILVIRLPESANLRLVPQDWTLTIELLAGAAIPLMAVSGKRNFFLFAAVLAVLKLSGLFTTYVFEFGMGVLIFLYWEKIVATWEKTGLPLKVMLAVATVILFSGCFTYPNFFAGSSVLIDPRVDRLMVGLGCMLCFMILLSSHRLQKIMIQPVFVYTGKICYSIYLVHQVLFLACWREFPDFLGNLANQPAWQIVSVYMVLVMAVMLISSLAYYGVENPMNLLGKRISAIIAGSMKPEQRKDNFSYSPGRQNLSGPLNTKH